VKRTTCRSCDSAGLELVIDLGEQSPSNALLTSPDQPEKRYPLRMVVCTNCWLMQTETDVSHAEVFNGDYPYYSGTHKAWRDHCARYSLLVKHRLGLDASSYVIEVGGNDGTLLSNFQCDTLNVEPAVNVAREAMRKNIPTVVDRFQNVNASRGGADLIIANNVLAHDPDLNGFAAAIKRNLARRGTCTIEFPWAVTLIENCEFDTIYHEHYSYLSLTALAALFRRHDLALYDAEYLEIHGGSVRAYVTHAERKVSISPAAESLLAQEECLRRLRTYRDFQARAHVCASDFLEFMRQSATKVLGAGAAAKATVFANFVGLTNTDIPLVGDVTPAKWDKYLPGSRIKIVPEAAILSHKPEFILVFPWNWKAEIAAKYRDMGYTGKFVTAIPKLEVF
jgi:hypothetical protein